MNKQKIIQAGKIASEIREWIKPQIKKDMSLLEIAEKIENKIIELGAKPAFPVNTSINEIAAHYTPSYEDESKAHGLLKIDFGIHVNGWTSDNAFSIDLENSEENKKIIKASEKALEKALEKIQDKIAISEIGKTIQQTIEENDCIPIVNLSGHSMEKYELHSGITIPNIDDKKIGMIIPGLYAIEPFATTKNATGRVKDGKPSGIYILINTKNIRSPIAREVLEYISEEYQTLPFCSRWLIKKFGTKALFALKQLEENENIHQYNQLIEESKQKVSQAEHTILIEKEKIITTL